MASTRLNQRPSTDQIVDESVELGCTGSKEKAVPGILNTDEDQVKPKSTFGKLFAPGPHACAKYKFTEGASNNPLGKPLRAFIAVQLLLGLAGYLP